MVKANNRQTTGSIFASKLEGREFGKYRAEKLISRHDFRQTITLLATNKETKEQVVLKAFGSFSVKSQKEFEKERSAFKNLENRHGVLLPLETFEYEGDYFIVTEYKNGGDLRGWLETKPGINEILDVFTRIAESIDYVHENKIIHRDIKPENVVYEVLDGKVTPYLMDFGISVTLSGATLSFETEHTFGTVEYMAPELFSNRDKKTKAVDIYAFGLMLYESLEGRHPLLGNTQEETISQILAGDVPLPEKTIKRLGENAGFMLVKALSKNPDNRPATATDIVTQVGNQYRKYVGKTYGKYITEEYLGQGLYGVTCKANELKKNKKVTIKLLTASRSQKPDIGDLKRLEHNKGIVPIIDAGCENGMPYLVSEYLAGDNLRHLFSPQGMEIQEVLMISKPLSATLDYLRGKGIIHCDLKPENILLQKNKVDGSLQPFVNDYGVFKVSDTAKVLNAKGDILWENLDYFAPEILDEKELSPTTDVYSLGVIIYEAIEGKPPIKAKSLPSLIKQKLDGYIPVPENLLEKGGAKAARVLLKALNVRPEKRQHSASELVSQLEDAITNQGFTNNKIFVGPWIKSRKLFSDLKKISNLSLVSGLLLLLIFLGAFSFIPIYLTTFPTATSTYTPTVSAPIIAPPTIIASPSPSATIPSPSATPPSASPIVLPTCKLQRDQDQEYVVPSHLLLQDVYRQIFDNEPDSYDLYAIVYYNNRKVLEGYKTYNAINPASLEIKKGWTILIPSQEWIKEYKILPATVPQLAQASTGLSFRISGSSILSPLSTQISRCSTETTKIELKQINSSTTVSGLRDLCQGNVDLFGAHREVDSKMLVDNSCDGVELEKFEVARYAMVIFINKDNPDAAEIQNHPPTIAELAELLAAKKSWNEVRSFWTNRDAIVRQYPPLESGDFEIVKDAIFPDWDVSQTQGVNTFDDDHSLIDAVANNKNAIGIVDYASYQKYENKNQLIAIPINGSYAGPEILDDATSKYPLLVTLYLYVGENAYETNNSLRSFINYYLSHEFDFLDDLGYLYPSRKGYMGNRDTLP